MAATADLAVGQAVVADELTAVRGRGAVEDRLEELNKPPLLAPSIDLQNIEWESLGDGERRCTK